MSSKNEAFYLKLIVSARINPAHRASRRLDRTQHPLFGTSKGKKERKKHRRMRPSPQESDSGTCGRLT